MVLPVAGAFMLLSTCAKDVYTPDACFSEDVLPIFISNCTMAGCHNANERKGDYDLTNYAGIMQGITPKHPLQSELYLVIRGNNPSMPQSPYNKLSSHDVNTIKAWIANGAPNSSNCRTCDTINFTYSGRVSNIMQTWCTGCHNSGSAGGGFNLANYNGVVSAIAGNKLLGSIQHLSGFSSMPKNAGQISQCDIDAIANWINAGYPNN